MAGEGRNSKILDRANAWFAYSQEKRRDIHRHPELGYREVRTAGIVASELNSIGYEVATGIAETGVVATLSQGDGPVVMLRFDMDALPIQEETGVPYASINPQVMHACGHDGHVAIGLTVAKMLLELQDEWRGGTVRLVFQPAEEGLGGAERMIAEGLLENPAPDCALSVHLWNERPVGWAAIHPGPLMAGGDIFTVVLRGVGGHGALPQNTVDPVVAAAQVILGLQTIVSRNISPLQSAIVSVTQVDAGDAFNIIPAEVKMRGTIRTYETETRDLVLSRFDTLVNGIAQAAGCTAEVDVQQLTPAVINDPKVADIAAQAAVEAVSGLRLEDTYRTTVSDDMAFILEKVPGCYLLVGSGFSGDTPTFSHHHPQFDFDEHALSLSAAILTSATIRLLNSFR